MSKFRSRLARYNTVCCEQVIPVPVIPVCAVSDSLPKPICKFVERDCSTLPLDLYKYFTSPTTTIKELYNYNINLPTPPTGAILTNSTGITPDGYLLCNGAAISRTTYAELFTVIGTLYGEGDGVTTFNIPNIPTSTMTGATYIIKT